MHGMDGHGHNTPVPFPATRRYTFGRPNLEGARQLRPATPLPYKHGGHLMACLLRLLSTMISQQGPQSQMLDAKHTTLIVSVDPTKTACASERVTEQPSISRFQTRTSRVEKWWAPQKLWAPSTLAERGTAH